MNTQPDYMPARPGDGSLDLDAALASAMLLSPVADESRSLDDLSREYGRATDRGAARIRREAEALRAHKEAR